MAEPVFTPLPVAARAVARPGAAPAELGADDRRTHASPRTFITTLLIAHSTIPIASSTPARM